MSNFVNEKSLTKINNECKILEKKLEVKNIKNLTVQQWIPIDKIYNDGIIKLKENKLIKILKINPINYNLKSDLEKEAILNSYKIFLKTCNFNIQILIQSSKVDLSDHIKNIRKNVTKKSEQKNNQQLGKIAENYIDYIQKLNLNRRSSSKNFYIVIADNIDKKINILESEEIIKNNLKEKYFKIKECLSRSGNLVSELFNKKEIEELFFSLLNTRKNLNKKLIN